MGDCGPTVLSEHSTLVDQPAQQPATPNEISVLVTGFGPFKTNLVNASFLIASSLPPSFSFPVEGSPATDRRIVLHVHPTPIPVAYASVRESLPKILHDFATAHGGRRPDLVIHIGIAVPRPYYSIEALAHRDDYHITDVNGQTGYEDGEKRWKEQGLPPILTPGRAITASGDKASSPARPFTPNNHMLDSWKAHAPADTDLRLSHDAGHYLCDFIYYTSMSLAVQQDQDRNVLFLHVPGGTEDADIERGRHITLALIKALVTCWIDEKHSA